MKRDKNKVWIHFRVAASWMLVFSVGIVFAQRPQDNWYLEQTWTKTMAVTNGGLSTPYGVAIGLDSRIYVGDQGAARIQVYLPDGTFSFAITNNFGAGESFSQPRGMITDANGNLYVADYARNAVFVFTANGAFIRKIGGVTGSGDGQLSGVIDVGVALSGEIYVLERGNSRVSVFDASGTYVRKWGSSGVLDGQLYGPRSLSVSPNNEVYVCQDDDGVGSSTSRYTYLKVFSNNGVFLRKFNLFSVKHYGSWWVGFCPVSVRVDPGNLVHVVKASYINFNSPNEDSVWRPDWFVMQPDGTVLFSQSLWFGTKAQYQISWPCHSVGPDGSLLINLYDTKQQLFYRRAMREQWTPPRNSIPMPAVIRIQQRPNSQLVDIDYQVTDADDTNVYTGLLIFTNVAQSLASCLHHPQLAEGTETNLGANVTANTPHRVTWNAAADWNTSLGNFRVAILAKDRRQGLLDIHYLRLPADRGMPELKISRSPLIANDFMQVWWWLLAINDPTVRLTDGKIYAVGGTYDVQMLCDSVGTSDIGRSFIYQKMAVREATVAEVSWAKQGSLSGGTNQWDAVLTVGGHPLKVNEYGFDTGNWGANAWWVVPLN